MRNKKEMPQPRCFLGKPHEYNPKGGQNLSPPLPSKPQHKTACPSTTLHADTVEEHHVTFWCRNFFLMLAHPVYKMWIIQEPNMLELWNKLHFEKEKNREYIPCLKYSVPIFVEQIYKMQL